MRQWNRNPELNRRVLMRNRRCGQEKFSKTTQWVVAPFFKVYTDFFTGEEGAGRSAELVLADTKRTKT